VGECQEWGGLRKPVLDLWGGHSGEKYFPFWEGIKCPTLKWKKIYRFLKLENFSSICTALGTQLMTETQILLFLILGSLHWVVLLSGLLMEGGVWRDHLLHYCLYLCFPYWYLLCRLPDFFLRWI
jgi:hypothetical protein